MSGRQKESKIPIYYQRRMSDETDVKNLFFGLALSNLVLNPVVVLFGGGLWLVSFIRARAVNHSNEKRIKETLFLTNPLIEVFSTIIAFYSIANIVNSIAIFSTTFERVIAYAGICLLASLIIFLFEHYFGEYLEWWSERAKEKEKPESNGFWTYVAGMCSEFSRVEDSPEERRKGRSQQRLTPISYIAHPDLPNPELSWIITIIRWLINYSIIVTFGIGLTVFSSYGFNWPKAVFLTTIVFFTSSFLTDQIKYLYFYWPYRNGHVVNGNSDRIRDQLITYFRGYWVTTALGLVIVIIVF